MRLESDSLGSDPFSQFSDISNGQRLVQPNATKKEQYGEGAYKSLVALSGKYGAIREAREKKSAGKGGNFITRKIAKVKVLSHKETYDLKRRLLLVFESLLAKMDKDDVGFADLAKMYFYVIAIKEELRKNRKKGGPGRFEPLLGGGLKKIEFAMQEWVHAVASSQVSALANTYWKVKKARDKQDKERENQAAKGLYEMGVLNSSRVSFESVMEERLFFALNIYLLEIKNKVNLARTNVALATYLCAVILNDILLEKHPENTMGIDQFLRGNNGDADSVEDDINSQNVDHLTCADSVKHDIDAQDLSDSASSGYYTSSESSDSDSDEYYTSSEESDSEQDDPAMLLPSGHPMPSTSSAALSQDTIEKLTDEKFSRLAALYFHTLYVEDIVADAHKVKRNIIYGLIIGASSPLLFVPGAQPAFAGVAVGSSALLFLPGGRLKKVLRNSKKEIESVLKKKAAEEVQNELSRLTIIGP